MELAVVDHHAHADDREADQRALGDRLLEALVTRRNELARNRPADGVVDELVVLDRVGRERLDVADDACELALAASLATRPLGAIIFGLMADRYGRRLPLMIDILFYSGVEVLSGLAPSYRVFLVLRLLYGIGMGGEWGVGASLAMESVPAKWRGLLSGLLQEGYAVGYLLAAGAYYLVFPHWGWRRRLRPFGFWRPTLRFWCSARS